MLRGKIDIVLDRGRPGKRSASRRTGKSSYIVLVTISTLQVPIALIMEPHYQRACLLEMGGSFGMFRSIQFTRKV
jgi:hypothetical protein